jgi:hypothetical protein
LALTNHRIEATEVSPGDKVPLTLVWRASRQLSDVNATVSIKTSTGQIVGTGTGLVGGPFSSAKWPVNRAVREQRSVTVAASSAAGDAVVTIQVVGGAEIPLGTVKVRGVKREFTAPTLAHPLNARFGDSVSLVGYDLSASTAQVGGPVTVSLGWRAERPVSTNYHVFLHLLDSSDKIWAQWDGVPRNWSYPMTAWLAGEYVLDRYALQIDPQAPSGDLTLEVGLYDAVSGQRVGVVPSNGAAPADRLILQQIRVVPR